MMAEILPDFDAIARYTRSETAFSEASRVLPGGVNSPVRAYKSVGRNPIFIARGKGAIVTDLDENEYIDYVGSYGPLILGHAAQTVVSAVHKAVARGVSFGMPTEAETHLARMVVDAVGSIDVVRFVNSGTEAVMSAIRLARAATGKFGIIKCIGCYHGHSDGLLVQAGSGATTLGVPSSPGVPDSLTQHTALVPFNDLDAVAKTFAERDDIAAMVIEPIAGNMGTIPPEPGYLQGLRELCDQHGALLIFDEVMTGFRVAYGGAQSLYGVASDLTCLGKIVGGGMPCAAYGGREDLMRQVAPDGPMYQAGTLSGNPLAMSSGLATLEMLSDSELGIYEKLEKQAARLESGLVDAAQQAGVSGGGCGGVEMVVQRVGSMICAFFTDQSVRNYEDATACDTKTFAAFFRKMLDLGIVLPPSQFETWFVSVEHEDALIDRTIESACEALASLV